jgi:hypothetical protein
MDGVVQYHIGLGIAYWIGHSICIVRVKVY